MQHIFSSKHGPEEYVNKNGAGEYPAAPKKCPFKDCGINLEMEKNGFYFRMLITMTFSGIIRIRRYKCPKCGRTLSMLPSFCISGYTYGIDFVIELLRQALNGGSVNKAVSDGRRYVASLSRRLVGKFLTRLRKNRKVIQYGLNQISPEYIGLGRLSGDTEWTKSFLDGIGPMLWPEFNAKFHNATGKSFMSLSITIA